MKKRTTYREKKYICGEFADVYIYPVYPIRQHHEKGKRIKKNPSREVQKRLNRRHAKEHLTRLLNANFTERDLFLTLTYGENPESEDQVKRDIRNFFRKLRRIYKKLGAALKYIWQMEKSKRGRYHVHIVMSGDLDRDEVEKLWGKGYANTKRLQFDRSGISALSNYITKNKPIDDDDAEISTYRSYNSSRNLIDPEPEISDSKIKSRKMAKELADMEWNAWNELYPEYEIADLTQFMSDEYGSVYIFARLHRKDCVRQPSKHNKKRK
jgi:hypothetical protein